MRGDVVGRRSLVARAMDACRWVEMVEFERVRLDGDGRAIPYLVCLITVLGREVPLVTDEPTSKRIRLVAWRPNLAFRGGRCCRLQRCGP